ncbi:thioredoxin family protein [Candidatus Micrarchaeota archaeon]|nr:thioredoxin family protein [Candidatus Micrarchaeota archaeon]
MTLTYSSYRKLGRGDSAPEFDLPGTDGRSHSLSEFRGKPVLIIFMCNHCPYVVPKLAYFIELQNKYPELQVIGINSNDSDNYREDSFEKMKEYSEKYSFNFIYLFDESQETAKAYGAECTPDPFLFDAGLKLVYHGRFDDAHGKKHEEGKTSEMEDAVRQLLEGKEVTVQALPSCGCNIKWK